jgi:branched-chain amino acid transport system permease protein
MERLKALAPAFAFALFGLVLIWIGAPVLNDWLFRVSLLALLTVSWNLMANAGLISLGHAAFWGAGTYATVLLANAIGVSPLLMLPGACVCGATLGLALAVATGRLRGIFFAISTLALSEGLRVVAFMLPGVTGGASGVFVGGAWRASPHAVLVAAVIVAAACLALMGLLTLSPIFFASRAMRNNERAAQMLGLDPRRYRMIVLAIAGAIAAVAGGLSIAYSSYVEPDAAFSMEFTIFPQIAALLGGLYTIWGSAVGAIAIVTMQDLTRSLLTGRPGVSLATFGCLLILCVLYMPRGVAGLAAMIARRRASAAA